MAKTKNDKNQIVFENIKEDIVQQNAEIFAQERMGSYSKYILQDRAIPDARDGLKPVQRRVLYAMYKLNLSNSAKKVKCARIVGETMGKYHPHGDSSIYEALVNLSQKWKNNFPLIDFQGNNGSINGDGAAASRYTEARLSRIADEAVELLNKDTVDFRPNYDDSTSEPTVLPTTLPLLMINGISGISIGFATDIPPFNLLEVLKVTKEYIKNPNITDKAIQKIMPAPDLPTGGKIIAPLEDILKYYKTGEGILVNECVWDFDKDKKVINITEIPYNTAIDNTMKQIETAIEDGKLYKVNDVYNRTTVDKETKQIKVKIELKLDKSIKENEINTVISLLFKNVKDLRKNLTPRNIAIVKEGNKSSPKTLSIKQMIVEYANHTDEVLTKSFVYDLKQKEKRKEIVEGLIKAHSIMDELIKLIRNSEGKADAKTKMIAKWSFSEIQAEAILTMQLHRLAKTDIVALKEELKQLLSEIERLKKLIKDKKERDEYFIEMINNYLKEYKDFTRKTQVITEVSTEIESEVDIEELNAYTCNLAITKHGWVYNFEQSSDSEKIELQRGDSILFKLKTASNKRTFLITSGGTLIALDNKKINFWRKAGDEVFAYDGLDSKERIIFACNNDYKDDDILIVGTKLGYLKSTKFKDIIKVQRTTEFMKFKENKDCIIDGFIVEAQNFDKQEIFSITKEKWVLSYLANSITTTGLKSSGSVSQKLAKEDEVKYFFANRDETGKEIKVSSRVGFKTKLDRKEYPIGNRATKGKQIK